MKILIVEDDKMIQRTLSEFLRCEGFEPVVAGGRKEAIEVLDEKPDLVLLDLSLPDGNGFSVCATIKEKYGYPVIFLTASDDEYSVVTGLDIGADDYITKPFRPRELVSRIKNVLRRSKSGSNLIRLGAITVDTDKGNVEKNGAEIFLSALEYRLLLIFINNKGKVLTRNALLEELWDIGGDFVNDNTLTVYVKRLRDKIEDDPQSPEIIKTVRGIGYRLEG